MSAGSRTSDANAFASADIGRTEGRYLLAVHRLAETTPDRVATGDLREFLDVSAASVSQMLAKLDDRGLVDHEKYQGVKLTPRGSLVAERLAWRFCVVTNFFSSVLDTELDDDDVAYEISVVLPESGVFNLRELTASPCIDGCPEADADCAISAT